MRKLDSGFAILCQLFFVILFINNDVNGQDDENNEKSKLTFFTSAQFSGGKYTYDSYSNIFLLYGGLKYQTGSWSIYGYLPVVAKNGPGITQSGGMIIPNGMDHKGNSDDQIGGNNMMGDVNGGMISNMSISFGDLSLYGSFQILKEYHDNIDLYLYPGIKVPTSSSNSGIGTGEFDYSISFDFHKTLGAFVLFTDVGYIKFGDPQGVDYNNSFTYGIGLGKYLSGTISILLYYNAYTEVLKGFDPPRQLLLGLNIKTSDSNILSISGSKGLSNYSSDFSINLGFNFNLRNPF